MEDVRARVARNLTQCRKAAGLTQLQVAEKLNYSDKAISKWERGEGLPDLLVLCELARLYGVTLDYFVHEHARPPRPAGGKRRILVCAMSVLLVWLVAVCCFAVLFLLDTEGPLWLAFVWALPVTFVVCVVFAGLWGGRWLRTGAVSGLIWTLALALWLTLPLANAWIVFPVAVPLEALAVFWFLLRTQKNRGQ